MEGPASERAREILGEFAIEGELLELAPVIQGHINASFVTRWRRGGAGFRLFHQRINRSVFASPELVMDNIGRATSHLRERLRREGVADPGRRALSLVPARGGRLFARDPAGEYWRCYAYIEGSRSLDLVRTPGEAREIGRGVGRFIRLLDGLPGPRLHEAIPRFHDAADRYRRFEEAVAADRAGRRREVEGEIDAFRGSREDACALSEALASGAIPERVVHNDCKANNILLDSESGEALCSVDLDTVGPGSLLYDFGDLVRTAAATASEDEADLSRVEVNLPLFSSLAHGFMEEAGGLMIEAERALMPAAGRSFALIMGLRFLTDYLEGDRYYRIGRERHNLDRARCQLELAGVLQRRLPELRRACEAGGPSGLP